MISEKVKSEFKAHLWEVEGWLRLGRLSNSRLLVVLASEDRAAGFIFDLQRWEDCNRYELLARQIWI
jgi:hypothetical protein